ncbi:MAG: hypothetical protein CBC13_04285 [Planctomycetia bacterium TMED53]|nr:MAG: hypothetical protein CBC13_04285 [Planctomycetia bacterium TMED53]
MLALTQNFVQLDLIQLAWTPGPVELVVILVVALLLFGSRLPNVMRNMGRGITEFKRGIKDSSNELKQTIENDDDDPPRDDSSQS